MASLRRCALLIAAISLLILPVTRVDGQSASRHLRAGARPIPDAGVRDETPPVRPPTQPADPLVSTGALAALGATSPAAATAPGLTLDDTENILVLGMDYRPGGKMWRTDSIMVVAVDQITRKAGVISIPRDLWVHIPGFGEGRINIADFYGEQTGYPGGGPALVGQILQDNLNITTHHWVRMEQEGLVRLVDTLGGVTITLDCPLFEKTPHPTQPGEYEYLQLPAGEVHLDGVTAKKFATFRYASTDFARARRQQQLIWAIRQRAQELDLIPLVSQLWTDLASAFQTDLNLIDVIRLIALGMQLESADVHGMVIPHAALQGKLVQGGSQVLALTDDRSVLTEALANLFASRPIAELGRSATGQCR